MERSHGHIFSPLIWFDQKILHSKSEYAWPIIYLGNLWWLERFLDKYYDKNTLLGGADFLKNHETYSLEIEKNK